MTFSPLRLFARAPADLDVMSAHVQDAVLQTGDMTFLDDKRRFVLVMNRFCWELPQKESLRVRSALQIGGIFSHSLLHFFRQAKGLLQHTQIFLGKSAFFTPLMTRALPCMFLNT